jgi:dipeptidyl aminopeptidase/acylaminoacyl peptidase
VSSTPFRSASGTPGTTDRNRTSSCSPSTAARPSTGWRTPSLITQGEIDFRVPLIESITTFKILQRQRVPFRLVTFPDEGHWILKGENGRHHLQEGLGWLKKYLDPPQRLSGSQQCLEGRYNLSTS